MRLSRARYVTICQQILVTAVVAAVGLSAAGVMTLEIVSPEDKAPGANAAGLTPELVAPDAYAATRPVAPKVREVAVSSSSAATAAAKKADAKVAVVSDPTPVQGYATVGVTWKSGTDLEEDDIAVQVRTRKDGAWSEWTDAAYHDEHGPDAGTAEAAAATRPGTDAVVVGEVDDVQMRAETADGQAPADLKLAVIDPGTAPVEKEPAAIDTAALGELPAAAALGDGAAADLEPVAMKRAPKPYIFSRSQWGANEKLRDKGSLRYGTVKAGFIHHTVNSNDYTEQQVPALLRGIYAYHTQSRGWSDIGYNYLVDRFGRIWEGRYGGVDKAVVGAHTLGYNEYAFAMSAIGNFDVAQPPQAVLDAYARLFAWKLSLYDIRADATKLYVKDRYLPAINGHRDVGKTACPGRYLYAKIGAIRAATQAVQNGVQIPSDPVNRPVIAAPEGLAPPTTKAAVWANQPKVTLPVRTTVAGSQWPDLVVKSSTGVIKVIPTEGILSYTDPVVNKGNWSAFSIISAVGDLTGDGKSDLIAKSRKTGQAWVFRSDGNGNILRPGIGLTTAFNRVKTITAVRDFTRDGRYDVVGVEKKTGSLLLYRGNGNGTFAAPVVLKKSWKLTMTAGVGDFNGDGQPDLMGISGDRTLYFVPGASRGTALGKAVRLGTLPSPVTALLGWGDLTGDGKADVVVRDKGTGLSRIRAGNGAGGLNGAFGTFRTLTGLAQVSMAPMTGTAAADVVGRDGSGNLVIVPNNGRKNLGAALPANLKVPTATQVLSVGDWDKDGRADVVVRTSAGNQLVLYPGLGNGKFGQPRSLGTGWKTITRLAAVGDVTGDGFPDLLGKVGSGALTIFRGNGLKAFKTPVLAPASLRTFNQIGRAAWSPRGAALISKDGSFVPLVGSEPGTALRAANGTATSAYDTYVGVGDVNGDGVADVLAREKGTGTVWLLPGKTSGGFAPRMWVAAGFGAYSLIG